MQRTDTLTAIDIIVYNMTRLRNEYLWEKPLLNPKIVLLVEQLLGGTHTFSFIHSIKGWGDILLKARFWHYILPMSVII